MRVTVVGSGYVGLVTGACLAEIGHTVVCVDKDPDRVRSLRNGEVPIYEPGLDAIVERNVRASRLSFSDDLPLAVPNAEVIFIAVGTPSRRGDGYADLSHVYAVASELAPLVSKGQVVATKSTVPVGTGDEVERILREGGSANICAVSNPEFLREGAAIEDFQHPDRVVIGAQDPVAARTMATLYEPITATGAVLVATDRRTAELIKYASNAFLAMKITFINEMSDLCEAADGQIAQLAYGLGLDTRIGPRFLAPGPGYGGSCFPKDTQALIKTGQDYGVPLRLVETAVAVNDQRKRNMVRKVVAACNGSVRGKTIGVLGLTFKPNTDDMRDSPAITLIQGLLDRGAHVKAYDPQGMKAAAQILPTVSYCRDAYAACEDADAAVLITEWDEFLQLNLETLARTLRHPVLVDLRNAYPPSATENTGLVVSRLGQQTEPVSLRAAAE